MNARALSLIGTLLLAAGAVCAEGCSPVDDRPAEWGYISPVIFQPNCATTSCHGPAAAVSGLDFSTPENGYASLTRLYIYQLDGGVSTNAQCATRPAPDPGAVVCDVRPLVTPFDPDGSRLVNMLLARDAPRMPPQSPLPMPDIELIERWILNGALEYPGGSSSADAGRDAPTPEGGADGAPGDGATAHDGARDSAAP